MKQHTQSRNKIAATAIAMILTAGGAALAGEGFDVELKDPYGNGDWTAQTVMQLRAGSDVAQSDPYGGGTWTFQTPIRLRAGADVAQNDPYGNGNWTAQRPQRLAGVMDVCHNRLTRTVIARVLRIELNCP